MAFQNLPRCLRGDASPFEPKMFLRRRFRFDPRPPPAARPQREPALCQFFPASVAGFERGIPPEQASATRPKAAAPRQSFSPPLRERSEEHTSELQSLAYLVCRLLLEKKKQQHNKQCRHIRNNDY